MDDVIQHDQQTSDAIRAALNQPVPPEEQAIWNGQEVVDYYKKNYDFVQIVRCTKCGSDLCLWVLDKQEYRQNLKMHHEGLKRIVLGNKLLSNRKRYDGIMGYWCVCGNRSEISPVEMNIVPRAIGLIPADEPHVQAMVRAKINSTGFKPKIENMPDGKVIIEGFEHERIK